MVKNIFCYGKRSCLHKFNYELWGHKEVKSRFCCNNNCFNRYRDMGMFSIYRFIIFLNNNFKRFYGKNQSCRIKTKIWICTRYYNQVVIFSEEYRNELNITHFDVSLNNCNRTSSIWNSNCTYICIYKGFLLSIFLYTNWNIK